MKTEFAIWMVSYLIRRGPDTQENIINEWSKYINEYLQPIITQYFIDNKSEIWLLFLIAHSKR